MKSLVPLPLSSHAKPVDSFAQAANSRANCSERCAAKCASIAGSRALYATDGSNYRQIPIGLVVPRDADDVIAAVAACRKFGAPVLPRGAGTSLAGQCCNVAVVLDFTKYMNRILEIDAGGRFARVQPGVVLDTLRDRAENHQSDVWPRPFDAQPLHARRHDRQQFLRHAFACSPARPWTTSRSCASCSTTARR